MIIRIKVLSLFLTSLFLIFSCKKSNNTSGRTGMEVHLTDGPTEEFDAINIDVQALEYNISDVAGITTGWQSISLKKPGIINLLDFQNGKDLSLSDIDLPATDIQQMRMKFGSNNSVLLKGNTFPLVIPDQVKQDGAAFEAKFKIKSGIVTKIWVDFNANTSVDFNPTDGKYYLWPDLRSFNPDVTGAIEGNIVPDSAYAVVNIYPDSSNLNLGVSAISFPSYKNNAGGYFKVVGLPTGYYDVYINANNVVYQGTQIKKVKVATGAVNNVGKLTLIK